MKSKFVACCIIMECLFFANCKKDQDLTPSFKGVWALRSTYGGSTTAVTFTPRSGNLLKFSNSRYQEYVKGQIMRSGTYRLKKDSIAIGDPLASPRQYYVNDLIIYDNATNGIKLKIASDTLITHYGASAADGVEYVYKKISDDPGF